MKQLYLLLKMYAGRIPAGFKSGEVRDLAGKTKSKAGRKLVGYIVIVLLLLNSAYSYFYLMAGSFNDMGKPELLLTIAVTAGCVLTLMTSVFRASSTLFGFKDFDYLMSMPIKPSTIVQARILTLYAYELACSLVVMLPALVAYFTYPPFDISFALLFVVMTLFVPALPTIIGSAIGTLISLVTCRMKRKNIIASILGFIFFGGMMALSFMSGSLVNSFEQNAEGIANSLTGIYPPAEWFMKAVSGDIAYIALFVCLSVAAFLLLSWLVGLIFKPLNAKLTERVSVKSVSKRDANVKTPFSALLSREFSRYISIPIYVMNTAFGTVMMVIAGVACFIFADTVNGVFGVSGMSTAVLPVICGFFTSLSATTPASISIEGKYLWVIKSLPVRGRDVLGAKLLMSILVILPGVPFMAAGAAFAVKADVLTTVMLVITPLAYSFFMSALGLVVNLKSHRFDWTSEAQIVKQGAPMFVSAFGSIFVVALPAVAAIITGSILVPVIVSVLFAAGGFIMWKLTAKKADAAITAL